MHELSIAIGIVELAEEEAQRRGGCVVNAVHLKLGPLSGVVKSALLASFEMAREGTALNNANLIIEETPLVAYCENCRSENILPSMQRFVCPQCNLPVSDV